MWEAYAVGTIPVGAVVVDPDGEIVSRGRNRILDEVHGTQLGRTRLAHAEINALLELEAEQTYELFTLYTALEPCHLCLAATYSARVGNLRYAAVDPYGGAVGKLLPSADHDAHPVTVEGPLPGRPGLLPELLHVAHFLWRLPDGNVMRVYRSESPQLVAAAEALPPPGSGATLADAIAALR
ncbi:MAG TPA: nucleoside deaminase [Gaiellaceae bacterium]